jgi:hypothetical protein
MTVKIIEKGEEVRALDGGAHKERKGIAANDTLRQLSRRARVVLWGELRRAMLEGRLKSGRKLGMISMEAEQASRGRQARKSNM